MIKIKWLPECVREQDWEKFYQDETASTMGQLSRTVIEKVSWHARDRLNGGGVLVCKIWKLRDLSLDLYHCSPDITDNWRGKLYTRSNKRALINMNFHWLPLTWELGAGASWSFSYKFMALIWLKAKERVLRVVLAEVSWNAAYLSTQSLISWTRCRWKCLIWKNGCHVSWPEHHLLSKYFVQANHHESLNNFITSTSYCKL